MNKMTTRPVSVFKWSRPEGSKYNAPFEKEFVGQGKFHQFGSDYEEFDSGAGNFSTAIVEMPDGHVLNIHVDLIRFDDVQPQSKAIDWNIKTPF